MLVLKRRRHEAILIDRKIEVIVLGVDRFGVVKLGITAPLEMPVHRYEVAEEIKREECHDRH